MVVIRENQIAGCLALCIEAVRLAQFGGTRAALDIMSVSVIAGVRAEGILVSS